MISATSLNRPIRLLLAILVVGGSLRVATILWGHPLLPYHQSFHPDEPKVYKAIASFPRSYLTDHRFLGYGNTVTVLLGTVLLPVKLIATRVPSLGESYLAIVWLVSRAVSVCLGLAAVFLVYILARRLLGDQVALLSAALLATSFYHTLNSAVATMDVTMSCLLLVNLLLCMRAIEHPTRSAYVVLGIASALLAGTKFTGAVFFGVPVVLMILQRISRPPTALAPLTPLRFLFMYFLSGAGVLAALHPHLFLDFQRYAEMAHKGWYLHIKFLSVTPADVLARLTHATTVAVSLPVTIFAMLGAVRPKRRSWPYHAVMVLLVLFQYVLWYRKMPARFLIFIVPLLCIFAASALVDLMHARHRAWKLIGTGATAVSLAYSLYLCGSAIVIRFRDTRPIAGQYLAETFSSGTTVGFSSVSETKTWKTHRWRYPKVDLSKFQEMDLWDEPELVVAYAENLRRMERALRSDKLGPSYVWDPNWNHDWYNHTPPTPRLFRFYEQFLRGDTYVLVRSFVTPVWVPVEFPPPEILIYRKVADHLP